MKILISGASGFIGSTLVQKLKSEKQDVYKLVRKKTPLSENEIYWDPLSGTLDANSIDAFEAVIHLAGENIIGRWTDDKKRKMRESRILGTQLLSKTLSSLKNPPKTFLCASAIGFYGNRGEENLTEESLPGNGFLADLCQEWEKASDSATQNGIRVIHYRIGVVLSAQGGALQKMILPFKMGFGGKIGNGKQWMSWIALDDLLEGIFFILKNPSISGAVNAVSPHPIRNLEFTQTLGKILHRPTFIPLPAFAAKLAFGEMAEEVLLASAKVIPEKLLKAGFQFKHPNLSETLSLSSNKQIYTI